MMMSTIVSPFFSPFFVYANMIELKTTLIEDIKDASPAPSLSSSSVVPQQRSIIICLRFQILMFVLLTEKNTPQFHVPNTLPYNTTNSAAPMLSCRTVSLLTE